MHAFAAADYLDLSNSPHASLFADSDTPVWSVLPNIAAYLKEHLRPGIDGDVSEQAFIGAPIFVGEGTVVEPGATIKGPAWIGNNCLVRLWSHKSAGSLLKQLEIANNSIPFSNNRFVSFSGHGFALRNIALLVGQQLGFGVISFRDNSIVLIFGNIFRLNFG